MHPADIAYVLEALPPDERLIVWNLVNPELEGEVLLEVSDAVRESLIDSMERTELVAAAETLDADELARLRAALDDGQIVLVAGFQGVSQDTKDVTTLGRGGSDTTAVALAAYCVHPRS